MQYIWGYIWHFLASHSRHGTHSPFVYQLVEEVIYGKAHADFNAGSSSTYQRKKKQLLLMRILYSFAYDDFELISDVPDQVIAFMLESNKGSYADRKISYFDTVHDLTTYLKDVTDRSVFVVNEPHLNTLRAANWKAFQRDERVIVTIDLYVIGLVFFRKGQRKENFLIRF